MCGSNCRAGPTSTTPLIVTLYRYISISQTSKSMLQEYFLQIPLDIINMLCYCPD